ncbi:MAG: VOC family protein [Nakamurella sp.]
MTLTPAMITVDTTDATALADWWVARTGGEVTQQNDGWFVVVQLPSGLMMGFQKVDDPTPGKNRVHLDFTAGEDLDAEAAALYEVGATLVGDRSEGNFRWLTLADPDGNQFCIAGSH